jgi:hypothetical protein
MKFIHVILIFCILLYLFTLNKITVEGFDNNIKFLSSNETYNLLKSNTEFYDTFYENDFKVRNISNINEYIEKIKHAVTDFTDEEKDILTECAKIADERIKKLSFNYFDGIKAAKLEWKFGMTQGNTYEGGLPHTVKDTIMLNRVSNINKEHIVTTLMHEKVHIYQKAYPSDYMKYLQYNNFTVVKKREMSDNIRANPDIDQNVYMKDNIIYKMVYNDNPKSIMDTKDNKSQRYEHPCETMAISLS